MTNIKRRGLMMVLSSPSGAGKTSLSRALLESDSSLSLSISMTTRAPRKGEIDGKDYFFVSEAAFHRMVDSGEFLEHAKVFDHYYASPKPYVMDELAAGRDILFDIDWQGAQQLDDAAHDDLVKIFIIPPSVDILKQRLYSRAQDSDAVVAARMAKASDEMSHYSEYDWVLVNDDFKETLNKIKAILLSERLRRSRQEGIGDFVKALRHDAEN